MNDEIKRDKGAETRKLSKRAESSKFISIACTNDTVYALDNFGAVWKYHPFNPTTERFAFWGKITTHRAPSP